jgi:hypothetical protein
MIIDRHQQWVSISEVARRTGHDRMTIRGIIIGPLVPEKKLRKHKLLKIEAFVPELKKSIEEGVLKTLSSILKVIELLLFMMSMITCK